MSTKHHKITQIPVDGNKRQIYHENPMEKLKELSLFTGIGGGVLGTKLLGWRHIGYVENNEYCQQILAQRIKDNILDEAPIFTSIQAFNDQGYAQSYQGMADVLSAGFPCQPFSVAGKRKGQSDERNLWPDTLRTIRLVRPRYAFLENVPGLLADPYIHTIFRDLAESGYVPRWRVLSAAELGAPHKRDRLWIVAESESAGLEKRIPHARSSEAPKPRLKQGGRWPPEPDVGRVAHGVPNRVDRLRGLGNAQVPTVAAKAWTLLNTQ